MKAYQVQQSASHLLGSLSGTFLYQRYKVIPIEQWRSFCTLHLEQQSLYSCYARCSVQITDLPLVHKDFAVLTQQQLTRKKLLPPRRVAILQVRIGADERCLLIQCTGLYMRKNSKSSVSNYWWFTVTGSSVTGDLDELAILTEHQPSPPLVCSQKPLYNVNQGPPV